MSYEPHEWVAGETVTASKLNNMEQGIANGGGVLVATLELPSEDLGETHRGETKTSQDNSGILVLSATITSHTWQELYDAVADGIPVILKAQWEYNSSSGDSEGKKGQTRNTDTFYNYEMYLVTNIGMDHGIYIIDCGQYIFYCSNPDDYPSSAHPDSGDDSGPIK